MQKVKALAVELSRKDDHAGYIAAGASQAFSKSSVHRVHRRR
jgi:hypothetical protein